MNIDIDHMTIFNNYIRKTKVLNYKTQAVPTFKSVTQTSSLIELGPRSLATEAGSPFILSSKEWISVQVGMMSVHRTAPTLAVLGVDLQAPSHQAMTIAAGWLGGTRDEALRLGKDICDFGHHITAQYPQIIAKLNDLLDSQKAAKARHYIDDILSALNNDTVLFKAQATTLLSSLTSLDHSIVSLTPTFLKLKVKYDKALGEKGKDIQTLRSELANRQLKLQMHNAEYNHYVVMAATKPTYAWVPFVGMVAAGFVTGIYRKKALEAKKRAEADASRISYIRATIDKYLVNLSHLDEAVNSLNNMSDNLQLILPVVQHIEGDWGAISSDIVNAKTLIEEAENEKDIRILKLSFEAAITQWTQLSIEAAGFLENALVAFEEDLSFGTYFTEVSSDGRILNKYFQLIVDFNGASVNGVPVQNPQLTRNTLSWSGQTNTSQTNLPVSARIKFTGTGFSGVCLFSGGRLTEWTGRNI